MSERGRERGRERERERERETAITTAGGVTVTSYSVTHLGSGWHSHGDGHRASHDWT